MAERIRQFKAQFPDGSLQSVGEPKMMSAGDKAFVVYCAAAYRTPDDQRPGIGWAWEPVPGPTPFTRDSELMNAETSAWGRAIVALGFDTKHVASSNEVENRQQFVAPETSGAEDSTSSFVQTSASAPEEPPSGADEQRAAPQPSAPEEPPVAAAERPADPATLRILKETVETLQKGFPSPDPTHSYWDDVRAYMIGQFAKNESKKLTEAEAVELVLHMEKRLVEAQRQETIPFG